MVKKHSEKLKKIFLSASIPDHSEEGYSKTSDLINIRDAVKALASVASSKAKIVYGGQPVITRLINEVMSVQHSDVSENVILYQSNYFEDYFPEENCNFLNKVFTPKLPQKNESLQLMRETMINNNDFYAGVFVGGMSGVKSEYELFIKAHPNAKILPVASTGGAAHMIYDIHSSDLDSRLKSDLGYMSLFRMLLELP